MKTALVWCRAAWFCGIVSAALVWLSPASSQTTDDMKDLPSLVRWMNATHRAPFRVEKPFTLSTQVQAGVHSRREWDDDHEREERRNMKVNQDHNPLPKVVEGIAANPSDRRRAVVLTNDSRTGLPHDYFHVHTGGGNPWERDERWYDDVVATPQLNNSIISTPTVIQHSQGIAIDRKGNSYISIIAQNSITALAGYLNYDTVVAVDQGHAHAGYFGNTPEIVYYQQCGGLVSQSGPEDCPAMLSGAKLAVDKSGTSTDGAIYVSYVIFCNSDQAGCFAGGGSIPFGGSALLVSTSAGPGQPFTFIGSPSIGDGSGSFFSGQGDIVIDSQGTPHAFFPDYTGALTVRESTYSGGQWILGSAPVVVGSTFTSCAGHLDTAYCTFESNQLPSGMAEPTPSIYLAAIDIKTGKATINRVNNDLPGSGHDHKGSSVAASPSGEVYVGWLDTRNDPTNKKPDFFLGKSGDGGKTFPRQQAINDLAGTAGYGFIASGPDSVVYAAWADNRAGMLGQVWSAEVNW